MCEETTPLLMLRLLLKSQDAFAVFRSSLSRSPTLSERPDWSYPSALGRVSLSWPAEAQSSGQGPLSRFIRHTGLSWMYDSIAAALGRTMTFRGDGAKLNLDQHLGGTSFHWNMTLS